MTCNNNFLGEVVFDVIDPVPGGVPQIEVTFNIDVNGILHVSACDESTGKKIQATFMNDQGLRVTEEEPGGKHLGIYQVVNQFVQAFVNLMGPLQTMWTGAQAIEASEASAASDDEEPLYLDDDEPFALRPDEEPMSVD